MPEMCKWSIRTEEVKPIMHEDRKYQRKNPNELQQIGQRCAQNELSTTTEARFHDDTCIYK